MYMSTPIEIITTDNTAIMHAMSKLKGYTAI